MEPPAEEGPEPSCSDADLPCSPVALASTHHSRYLGFPEEGGGEIGKSEKQNPYLLETRPPIWDPYLDPIWKPYTNPLLETRTLSGTRSSSLFQIPLSKPPSSGNPTTVPSESAISQSRERLPSFFQRFRHELARARTLSAATTGHCQVLRTPKFRERQSHHGAKNATVKISQALMRGREFIRVC